MIIKPGLIFCFPNFDLILALHLIFFLYAETHYHFRYAPSLLFRRRPEIIADAPYRLEPGHALPVLLIIKDAHRFPTVLQQVHVEIALLDPNANALRPALQRLPLKFTLQDAHEEIRTALWWRTYFVDLPDELAGRLSVNVGIAYRCRGRAFYCWNDNHIGTSHAPLQVFRSRWPLPTLPDYYHGDLHFHSDGTNDQVEFGAPVEAVRAMAIAQGLSFCAVTDHSYDLDDYADDCLRNDPELRKWQALQERIGSLNETHHDFVLIPGEEVSCGNAVGDNVHFLILNHPHYIPGCGDSGEKWLRTAPDCAVRDILDQLDEQALAFAAHPAAPVPFLQRKLLRRACWQPQDFEHPRLHGMQFWNGGAQGEDEGLRWWVNFLLEGKKLSAIAGNDAHGNFNRFRQVSLPCLTMVEHPRHVFGRFHTAIKLEAKLQLGGVLQALRQGRMAVTNGIMLELEMIAQDGESDRQTERMRVRALSSPEFGRLQRVTIWRGNMASKKEEMLYAFNDFADGYQFEARLDWAGDPGKDYIRAEALAFSEFSSSSSHALTNPIWLGGAPVIQNGNV